jgi:hypothetical protein
MNVELSVTALWIIALLQSIFLVVLYRQVGLHLLSRSEAIARDGLKVGQRLPRALISQIEASRSGLSSGPWSKLIIVFARHRCNVCRTLWPELPRFTTSPSGFGVAVVIVLAADSTLAEQYRAEHRLEYPLLLDPKERLFNACRVRVSPFAIVTDANFTVRRKGLVNNQEHLAGC